MHPGLLACGKGGLELACNRRCYFALNRENVGCRQFPVVALGPDMSVGARVNELHVNPHTVTGASYATMEDAPHAELCSDCLCRQFGIAELLDGRTRNHLEGADPRQLRQDIVVYAV